MTEDPKPPESDDAEPGPDVRDDDPMRALLRGALKKEAPEAPPLLPAVQRKLRVRSRGKFYGDGWSTAHQTTSYLLVALIMLAVLGSAYYVLASVK